jgi:hypothetical protein
MQRLSFPIDFFDTATKSRRGALLRADFFQFNIFKPSVIFFTWFLNILESGL